MKKSIFTLLFISAMTAVVHAQSVNFEWARQFGGPASDVGFSVAVDATGNVYNTGTFQGTVDFDPGPGGPFISAGGNDIYLSKIDPSGTFLWAIQIGGTGADASRSVVVDGSGNVYITGSFTGTVDFDPGPGGPFIAAGGAADLDIFVAKFNGTTGSLIWAKQMGGTSPDEAFSVAVDVLGGVYTTGYFRGTANFDPNGSNTRSTSGAADLDIFVSKLDATGSYVWAGQMGGTAADFGIALRIDQDGNVVSTGSFSGTADLDPVGAAASLTAPAPSNDIYVSKLGADGSFIWAKQLGNTTTAEQANGIAVDGSGNIYTTGYFDGSSDFDPDGGVTTLTTIGGRDIFVSKLNSSGSFVWAKSVGNPANAVAGDRDMGFSIAVDAAANVYATGSFANTVDFNPDPAPAAVADLTSAGERDIFLLILNSAGDFVLARAIGSTAFDQGESIALNPSTGNIHMTGRFAGTVDFDPGAGVVNLVSDGGTQDLFVLKLSQLIAFPVKLTDFTAKLGNQSVQLQWRTAAEENASHFEIEKSTNGTSFAKLGSVQATGNSSSIKNYSFNDQQPLNGNNYYRLKMIDIDGTFSYSKVIAVKMNGKTTLQVFPNPAKNILYVQASGNDKNSMLRITDAGGKIVKEQKIVLNGTVSFSVDITSLPKGLYYFTLRDGSKIQQQKIIKQ